jgi:hypothetical protein
VNEFKGKNKLKQRNNHKRNLLKKINLLNGKKDSAKK